MKLVVQGANQYNGCRYRVLFDSRQWEWIVQATDKIEVQWVTLCTIWDEDKAVEHFNNLINQKTLPPRIFTEDI